MSLLQIECLCPLPNAYGEILCPVNMMVQWGRAFRRWLDHECGTLMNGLSAFVKGTLPSCLSPFTMWRHSTKTAIYEPGSRFSPDTKTVSTLILDFLTSGTVRDKCVLFKPSSLQYFCYSSLNWLRQSLNIDSIFKEEF